MADLRAEGDPDRVLTYDLVRRAAALWPDSMALSDDSSACTFRELAARVGNLAGGFGALGFVPGDRIIDLQKNSLAYVLTDLGIPAAGLIRVAVNSRLTDREIEYIVNDCEAAGLVYGNELRDRAQHLMERCPSLKVGIGVTDRDFGPALSDVEGLSQAGIPDIVQHPSDVVSLNYSSGTTGKPKGCMRSARNRYMSMVDILTGVFGTGFGPHDVMLHAGPITHASGLFVLPSIAVGAHQHLMSTFDAARVARQLESGSATATVLVPTMLERVMAELRTVPSSRLRAVVYAGAPMPVERIKVARELFGGKLVQFYGMVEAIPPISILGQDDHRDDSLLTSAGRPPLGVHIRVVDVEGRLCGVDDIGEVLVFGDHVMTGYWGQASSDGKALGEGVLHTGDMGRLDARGYLHLVDRQGDMIITGGYNVYPREVEDAIRRFEGVADVAVVGVPHPDWGQAITAFVVMGHAEPDVNALMTWCARELASFKKPKQVYFVSELPRTPIGKVDRKALAAGERLGE